MTADVAEPTGPNPYKMTISLNVLKDLGIGLYSNVPAVLAEMVANAWDADANLVAIDVDITNNEVRIHDNGNGMDLNDINNRFLRVGYDRRADLDAGGEESPRLHRKVMGRKGIGKLSCFSIAETVDVVTAKGKERNALRMSRNAIKAAVANENPAQSGNYSPTDIRSEATFDFERGTKLILRGFDKRLNWTEAFLRRRIARRFSIIGPTHKFQVEVNGKRIVPSDREFYKSIQFLWHAGEEGRLAEQSCKSLERSTKLEWVVPRLEGDDPGEPYVVTGWIGTVRKPEDIGSENNTITIFAKGKVVQEDILKDIKEARVFAEYLIGELHAEFADDKREDIVTSDRQRLKETDRRYEALRSFVEGLVKRVGNEWDDLRIRGSEQSALKLSAVSEWYQRLQEVQRAAARKMFGRIESLKLPSEEARKELYRASILAFERVEYQDILDGIRSVSAKEDDERLRALFDRFDAVEGAQYFQIVTGRSAILDKIDRLGIDAPGWRDAAIRKYLPAHPWMLDPALERATVEPELQTKLDRALEKHPFRTVCLRLLSGRTLLEVREGDQPTLAELSEQVATTIKRVAPVLQAASSGERDLEPVCLVVLVDSPPRGAKERSAAIPVSTASYSARYVTYADAIAQTLKAYRSYLKRQQRVSEIVEMMARIEADLENQRRST